MTQGYRREDAWDVAIVAVLLASVVSVLLHAAPAYGLIRAATKGNAPTPPATAAPTGGPTASASPSTPSATPSPSASSLPVPAMPAYDKACLRRDNPRTGAKLPKGDPFGDDITRLGDKAEVQRLYAVRGGTLEALDGLGAPRQCDLQLWALVTATAPTLVVHLEELLVFDSNPNPVNGEFVIEGESAPRRTGEKTWDDSKWRLSFAPNGLDRSRLAWLVAHELAHIASLNSEQLLDVDRNVCPTQYVGTGCLIADSYVMRYLGLTWDDALWDAWEAADRKSTESARRTAYRALFEKHRSSFVTGYAAFHPLEDFAESFAMWCTYDPSESTRKQLPTAKPTDSGSKVAWFDQATRDLLPAFSSGCTMLRQFAAG